MKTLIMFIAVTALLFSACMPECQEPVFDQQGNFSHMQDIDCNTTAEQNAPACNTSFMLGQPASGSIRAIQVDTQGYLNGNGYCVFDLSLYEAALPVTPTNIEWTVDGNRLTIGQSFITMEVPTQYTLLCVNYNVGSQSATSCRSFE